MDSSVRNACLSQKGLSIYDSANCIEVQRDGVQSIRCRQLWIVVIAHAK